MNVQADLPRFIDIAVNLTDPVFRGNYHGKQCHQDDFARVMDRARSAGVVAQIVTGGSLQESKEALELCQGVDDLTCTVGCHPTRSGEFDQHTGGKKGYLEALAAVLEAHAVTLHGKGKGKAVAVGECGLDYDRLHFAPAETQREHFASQLSLAERFRLPLFLHSRAAAQDFASIIGPRMQALAAAIGGGEGSSTSPPTLPDHLAAHAAASPALRVGCVHSFTGTLEEMNELVELGLYIGINGCSLKTEENLAVVKALPLDRLMLETDAPWCDMRPTHASAVRLDQYRQIPDSKAAKSASAAQPTGLLQRYAPPAVKKEKHSMEKMVKGRNEPCAIGQVALVVAAIKGLDITDVSQAAERNTRWLFGL